MCLADLLDAALSSAGLTCTLENTGTSPPNDHCTCLLSTVLVPQFRQPADGWTGGEGLPSTGYCLHLPSCPAGVKMPDHCNAYDTPFYVNLKSSLKEKQAVASEQQPSGRQRTASEQQHSGRQRAASEQQARSGSTAAEGGLGAAALHTVCSALGVSSPAASSSPGKAKGKEALSQQSPQVSPMSLCGLRALLGDALPAVP